MLQELLVELVKRANAEQAVTVASMADGVHMLVYPLDNGVLVGIGLEGARAASVDPARLLHKRASNMALYGGWLPAQLQDGAWYVLKRMAGSELDMLAHDERDLEAAAELIS